MLERRSGLYRGIYGFSHGDGRLVDRAALRETQYCGNAMLNHGGFSAYQLAFGPNTVDLYSWEDDDRDLDFAENISVSSQSVLRWKLRVMAQGAMSKGMANSKLRRILGHDRTFGSTDVEIGCPVIF